MMLHPCNQGWIFYICKMWLLNIHYMTAAALSSVPDILSVAKVNTQYPVWTAAALSSVLDILSMAILCLIYSPATSDRGIIYHAVGRGEGRGLFPVLYYTSILLVPNSGLLTIPSENLGSQTSEPISLPWRTAYELCMAIGRK
jgi:hypothetical protein